VLVVGAAASGVQIAVELADSAHVTLAGRPTPHVPDPVLRWAPRAYWLLIHHLLTVRTPIGRKAAIGFHSRGGPLIRTSIEDATSKGVSLRPRVTGTEGDTVLFADGTSLQPDTVIWATGSTPDLAWIAGLPLGLGDVPVTQRGAVEGMPGLFTMGMPFQYGLTSAIIGGVGRDAAWIADRIAATRAGSPSGWRPRRAGSVRRVGHRRNPRTGVVLRP
jgi:putative flavoprotein involved in K+ transport